jgi:hypothetical protein
MNNTTVTVYSFKKYDISKDDYIKSKRMGTEDAIKRFGGLVISETAIDIPAIDVNGDGLTGENYSPVPNRFY